MGVEGRSKDSKEIICIIDWNRVASTFNEFKGSNMPKCISKATLAGPSTGVVVSWLFRTLLVVSIVLMIGTRWLT